MATQTQKEMPEDDIDRAIAASKSIQSKKLWLAVTERVTEPDDIDRADAERRKKLKR